MSEPKRYEDVNKAPSRKVWSGCGDGRCMPCGHVHDFGQRDVRTGRWMPRLRCAHNWHQGCPIPLPEKKCTFGPNHRCVNCGRTAMYIAPDGEQFRTISLAKTYGGWKASDLKREDDPT